MTIEKFYELIKGDYNQALSILMNDRIIEKFVLKFPQDETMANLINAVSCDDIEVAFRCAHTLKGVAANLAFTNLQKVASIATEQMRGLEKPIDKKLIDDVKFVYNETINAIKQYELEK